jgi:hypothetical protein
MGAANRRDRARILPTLLFSAKDPAKVFLAKAYRRLAFNGLRFKANPS